MSESRLQTQNLKNSKKFGEITSTDGRNFGLDCLFCDSTFFQLEVFIEHIQELHSTDILTPALQPEEFADIKVESDFILHPLTDNKGAGVSLLKGDDVGKSCNTACNEIKDEITGAKIYDVIKSDRRTDVDTSSVDSDFFVSTQDVISISKKTSISLDDKQLKQFVDIYKKYDCLWDLDREESRCKVLQSEALSEMLEQVSPIVNTKLTINELQKLLSRLKNRCMIEKRRHQKAAELGNIRPASEFYKLFQFLVHFISPYKCEKCSQLFPSYDRFHIHMAEHDGVKAYVCKICGKDNYSLGALNLHIRRHKSLENNLKIKMPTRFFLCEICGKIFTKLSALSSHKERSHFYKKLLTNCTSDPKADLKNNKSLEHMDSK